MSTAPAPYAKADIQILLKAIASDTTDTTLAHAITSAQWDVLAMLTVHFEDATGKIRLAAVGAGAVVGEGGFFSRMARSATVQAGSACRLWTLSPMRFSELANRQPNAALALAMALGAIMARRLVSNRRRIAVT